MRKFQSKVEEKFLFKLLRISLNITIVDKVVLLNLQEVLITCNVKKHRT